MSYKLTIYDLQGKTIGDLNVANNLYTDKIKNQAIFDSVIAENASHRQGTHSTLNKGEVRGGGKKPYAQKHTGNARQGSIRNPHYVGGGVVFGPKPTRNYKNKVNRKVNQIALVSALTTKLDAKSVFVLGGELNQQKPKTKVWNALLKELKLVNQKVLFVFAKEKTELLLLSARNINRVTAKKVNQVSAQDLLNAKYIIIQKEALDSLSRKDK